MRVTKVAKALHHNPTPHTPPSPPAPPSALRPLRLPCLYSPSPASLHQAVDLWSFGVTLYIALCAFPPFFAEEGDDVVELRKLITPF